MEDSIRDLSLAQLHHLDSLISIAQEQDMDLSDVMKPQSEICCCGAIATKGQGRWVYSDRDQEILGQIAELEAQIESAPTLGQLIELRGEMLRAAKRQR